MVNIANKDFNMDMDKYLSRRRYRESRSDKKSLNEVISDMKSDVIEWKVFSLFKKNEGPYVGEDGYEEDFDDEEDYSEEESELEAIDDLEEDLEEKRDSVLQRFFKKLRLKRRRRFEEEDDLDDDYHEEDKGENDWDDVREVMKITHKWLERLSDEEVERFKRSEDFAKYKELLRKLGMIK